MNNTMGEGDLAIGNGQGLEKGGLLAVEVVDGHGNGFDFRRTLRIHKQWGKGIVIDGNRISYKSKNGTFFHEDLPLVLSIRQLG